jgi:hypothetical protein
MKEFQEKQEFNKKLIGKTVYWMAQKDEFVGKVIGVEDKETILVEGPEKILYKVSIFDITQTV